jgi:hypothetical protein
MHKLGATIAGTFVAIGLLQIAGKPLSSAAEKASQAKILDELTNSTQIDFTEVPLSDGIEYLADYHDIPIVLDETALGEAKVGLNTPISYQSKQANGVPLYRALWEMLGKSQVSFMIEDRRLLITSPAKARAWQAEFVKSIAPQLERGKK